METKERPGFVIVTLVFFFLPLLVLAGSQTYSTPGSYSFTVPSYGTLTVEVWGAGGGGGSGYTTKNGSSGGNSTFEFVFAGGGSGGSHAGNTSNPGGAGGYASGGTTNQSGTTGQTGSTNSACCPKGGAGGAGANGGAGGAGAPWSGGSNAAGVPGTVPGGGGGGAATGGGKLLPRTAGGGGGGAYASKTYSVGELISGSSVDVNVGSGGAGGPTGPIIPQNGGNGAAGKVVVTWTDPAPCTVNYGTDSATITGAGTCTFTVPAYGSLTVKVWGGGGGGGSAGSQSGSAGAASSFNASLIANGGGGGLPDFGINLGGEAGFTEIATGGSGGSASGGTTNTTGASGQTVDNNSGSHCGGGGGSAPSGGSGGAGQCGTGSNGSVPGAGGGGAGYDYGGYWNGGGGGGSGGYTTKTYAAGELTTGAGITAVVGYGGTGGWGNATGGTGATGQVTITWSSATPSCSVLAEANPLTYGNSTSLSWTSANATSFYITNIGYVAANATSSTLVGPLSSTAYNGTAIGSGGTTNCDYTLTVNAPSNCALPWGGTLNHGSSVTAYQASTVPYGSSCVSESRSCANGVLSGSYTNQSCAVGPTCSLSVNPGSVVQGQSATLSWSSINATSCTGDNFNTSGAPAGNVSVSPSQTTTYTASCSGVGGTTQCTGSGGGTGQSLPVSCTPSWSCVGGGNQTIRQTNADCSTVDLTTCVSPQFCTAGSSTCVNPVVTGSISASPRLVPSGGAAKITWTTSDAVSCTVTGSNGDSWSGVSSAAASCTHNGGACVSSPITEFVSYTLTCDGGDVDTVENDLTSDVKLYRVPSWLEV